MSFIFWKAIFTICPERSEAWSKTPLHTLVIGRASSVKKLAENTSLADQLVWWEALFAFLEDLLTCFEVSVTSEVFQFSKLWKWYLPLPLIEFKFLTTVITTFSIAAGYFSRWNAFHLGCCVAFLLPISLVPFYFSRLSQICLWALGVLFYEVHHLNLLALAHWENLFALSDLFSFGSLSKFCVSVYVWPGCELGSIKSERVLSFYFGCFLFYLRLDYLL